jgi:glyoxylase-like metal-dependent hydrolase (beta-lactamase superfamily II)
VSSNSVTTNDLSFEVIAGDYNLLGNQPANYTLVKGESDVLLVDAPFARCDAHRLIAAILNSGKELRTIYITHDHPDHFFSLDLISDTFPKAAVMAHRVVAKDMERSIPLKFRRWGEGLGANAPQRGVVPAPLDGDQIEVGGQKLQIVGPMQGDHIPLYGTLGSRFPHLDCWRLGLQRRIHVFWRTSPSSIRCMVGKP